VNCRVLCRLPSGLGQQELALLDKNSADVCLNRPLTQLFQLVLSGCWLVRACRLDSEQRQHITNCSLNK